MLALSVGCPSGIGPEVSVRALAEGSARDVVLVGDFDVIVRAVTALGVDCRSGALFQGISFGLDYSF